MLLLPGSCIDKTLLSLRLQVFHPTTRIHVRLLGPCFKTGRIGDRLVHQRTRRCRSQPMNNTYTASCKHVPIHASSTTTHRTYASVAHNHNTYELYATARQPPKRRLQSAGKADMLWPLVLLGQNATVEQRRTSSRSLAI